MDITTAHNAMFLVWLLGAVVLFLIVDGIFYFTGATKSRNRLVTTYLVLLAIFIFIDALRRGNGGPLDYSGAPETAAAILLAYVLSYFRMRGRLAKTPRSAE